MVSSKVSGDFQNLPKSVILCISKKQNRSGVYLMITDDNQEIILSVLHNNLCCGCPFDSSGQGDSYEHPHHRIFQLSSNIYLICSSV